MSIAIIFALSLLTLAVGVLAVQTFSSESARRRAYLDRSSAEVRASGLTRLRSSVEYRVLRSERGRRLQLGLIHAAVSMRVGEFVILVSALVVATGVIGYTIGGPVLAGIIVVVWFFGVRAWLDNRREKRRIQFIDQLPDLARMLANATEAGLALRTAMLVAARELPDPARSELEIVNDELSLGQRMEDALGRFGDRLPSRELKVLVNVLVIQARAGGQIITALRGLTESLETRRDLRREVNALLSGSRATAIAVGVLGLLIVALVHFTVEGGLETVLSDPIGIAIAVVSGALFAFGFVLVRRLGRVEA